MYEFLVRCSSHFLTQTSASNQGIGQAPPSTASILGVGGCSLSPPITALPARAPAVVSAAPGECWRGEGREQGEHGLIP